ncbi:MAG: sulfatase activating formylglycine-generating enzyme [Myxococcota bacterium]|jgi:formylglycine-generating enzyme required for sulfatase activity
MRFGWFLLSVLVGLGCGSDEAGDAAGPAPCGVVCDSMALVQGGKFRMGSPEGEGTDRSQPQHLVDIAAPYFMDPLLVTNGQFAAFLQVNGLDCSFQGQAFRCYDCSDDAKVDAGIDCDTLATTNKCTNEPGGEASGSCDNHPVTAVTWYGANAYCQAVGKRLPTEAQWERAANGPGGIDGGIWQRFSWGSDCPAEFNETEDECSTFTDSAICLGASWTPQTARANCLEAYCNDGFDGTSPVGWFESGKTAEGLYDMTGNIMEWVDDCWHESYAPTSGAQPPADGSAWATQCDGPRRAATGGGWLDCGSNLRMAFRGGDILEASDPDLGFRCAHDF